MTERRYIRRVGVTYEIDLAFTADDGDVSPEEASAVAEELACACLDSRGADRRVLDASLRGSGTVAIHGVEGPDGSFDAILFKPDLGLPSVVDVSVRRLD